LYRSFEVHSYRVYPTARIVELGSYLLSQDVNCSLLLSCVFVTQNPLRPINKEELPRTQLSCHTHTHTTPICGANRAFDPYYLNYGSLSLVHSYRHLAF